MAYLLDHSFNDVQTHSEANDRRWIVQAEPTNFEIHIDQDGHRGRTTPIASLYLREIAFAMAGDKLIILQKSITQPQIARALVEAACRGVAVIAVYRDHLNPECEAWRRSARRAACREIFRQSRHPHHKSMMVRRADGTVRAVIGSYNTRLQKAHERQPRTHTALFFEVPAGDTLFAFYHAEVNRLFNRPAAAPKILTLCTQRGEMKFTMHPSRTNPVLELLNDIPAGEHNTIWLSYYQALLDREIGHPILVKLRNLRSRGCTVRVLLDANRMNAPAYKTLKESAVEAQWAKFPTGRAILGHKLALAKTRIKRW